MANKEQNKNTINDPQNTAQKTIGWAT